MKTVFTTGEAAKICKVSQQTIIRCFDSGQLKGFRVPGSRFRRIPRDQLYAFMRDNGFGAGMLIKEFRPDLVVLDVMLPDINGIEVCRLVRSDKTMDDVRVICISGMVEEDKIQQLRDAGANEFLKKPFDVEALIERICQLLDVETVPHS
jgi:excisionase family DNA binding protein